MSGYSGTSGTSGPSGISGFSGTSGISGWSGFSGFSGFSGTSGISGYSGTSGISGYSGFSGTSGVSGYSGMLPTYTLPETYGTSGYVNIGTWNTSQGGCVLVMEIASHAGYNASTSQDQYTTLYFKTSNNSSSQSGVSGAFYADGVAVYNGGLGANSQSPSNFYIVQNNSSSYTIYAVFGVYSQNSWYRINVTPGTSWTNSSTIAVPTGNYLQITPTVNIIGSGTSNYITKWSGSFATTNSIIQDNGTTVTVGGNLNINGGIVTEQTVLETTSNTGLAPAATTNFDVLTQGIQFYTSNNANNWVLNIRGNSTTTLNSTLGVGQTVTLALIVTNGATPWYQTATQIDGTAVTPKWQGGSAPSSGNANANDIYTFSVTKLTSTPTYAVFASIATFK